MKTPYAIAILICAALLQACAIQPPKTAPGLSDPPAMVQDEYYVTHQVSRTVNWDRVSVRRWLEKEQLITFFPKDMELPSVVGQTPMRGNWGENGAIRRVELNDGHFAFDHILNNRYPDVFQYQVYGFTNLAGRISEYVYAEIKYEETKPNVTEIVWTYRMRPKSSLTKPVVQFFITRRLAPYMEAGMTNMARAAEIAAAKAKN